MTEAGFALSSAPSRIRKLPVGWRMALPLVFNLAVFAILSGVIWQAGRVLEHHWTELMRVADGDRLLEDIEADAERSKNLIYRYLDQPNDGTLAEINRINQQTQNHVVEAGATSETETAHDLELVGEASRQLFAGFEMLRQTNARNHDLYGNKILLLVREISDLYSLLDQNTHSASNLQWPILTKSREAFTAALLSMNTHYHRGDQAGLAQSARDISAIARSAPVMRDTAQTELDRAAVIALATRIEALGKDVNALSQGLATQARLLDAAVGEPEARLSAAIHRLMTVERRHQSEAHHRFYLSLARVGGAVVVIGVAFIAVSFTVSLVIARSVANPIADLVVAMAAVAGGDYHRGIPGLNESDEIGVMARALEVFQRNAKNKQRLEQEMEAQERRWRTVLENSPVGISIVATDTLEQLYLNPRSLEMLGATSEAEALAVPVAGTFVEAGVVDEVALRALQQGGVDGFEVERCRPDGSTWWCALHLRHIEIDDRQAFIVWQYDITERRKVEADLRAAKERAEAALAELKAARQTLVQSEKMAVLGGLVAGITHEISTPLGINVTTASLLHEESSRLSARLEGGTLRRSDLSQFLALALESSEMLLANCRRASQLIKGFKQVAVDQSSEERRTFTLRTYIDEVLISLGPQLKNPRIGIVVNCPEGLTVDSFPGPLAQVLTNFIINSLSHAFSPEQSGHMTITVTNPDPKTVELVYADDGRGIAQDVLPHIFEPFFTTNRAGGGSGLGLNIVEKLVRQRLGGNIAASSQPGQGTRFTVRFPRVA